MDNYLFAIGGSHVLDDVFTSVFTSSYVTLQPTDDFSPFPPLPFKHAGGVIEHAESRAFSQISWNLHPRFHLPN